MFGDDGEIPTYDIAFDVIQVCDGDGHALAPGWNLLALRHAPLPAAEPALDEIGTQGGDADLVARWLSDSDIWESHAKTRPYNNYCAQSWVRATLSGPLQPVPGYVRVPLLPIQPRWISNPCGR